jgi:small subunit ribosomal protein S6
MANSTPLLAGYETTFITRSEMSDDALKALHEKVNGVISSFNGEVVLTEDWGKRKLAYPIQKEARGHYSYFVYTGKGGVVHEIERNLRLHDHVLRFLTVNLEEEFNADGFRKSRADWHAAQKRREEEREARREERFAERRGYDDRGDRGHHDDRGERAGAAPEQAEASADASGASEE